MFLLVLVTVLVGFWKIASLRDGQNWVNDAGKCRKSSYQTLYLANRIFDYEGAEREDLKQKLRMEMKLAEQRYKDLHDGNPELGLRAATDPDVVRDLESMQVRFAKEIKPCLERILEAPTAGSPAFTVHDILYHQLHTPPQPPTRFRADIPLWLESICMRLLAKRPDERFTTPDALLLAFRNATSNPS